MHSHSNLLANIFVIGIKYINPQCLLSHGLNLDVPSLHCLQGVSASSNVESCWTVVVEQELEETLCNEQLHSDGFVAHLFVLYVTRFEFVEWMEAE